MNSRGLRNSLIAKKQSVYKYSFMPGSVYSQARANHSRKKIVSWSFLVNVYKRNERVVKSSGQGLRGKPRTIRDPRPEVDEGVWLLVKLTGVYLPGRRGWSFSYTGPNIFCRDSKRNNGCGASTESEAGEQWLGERDSTGATQDFALFMQRT